MLQEVFCNYFSVDFQDSGRLDGIPLDDNNLPRFDVYLNTDLIRNNQQNVSILYVNYNDIAFTHTGINQYSFICVYINLCRSSFFISNTC